MTPITFRPRIQRFRDSIIAELPRAPATGASKAALIAMPTHRLILAFVTWRMRFVRPRPRKVTLWPGSGVTHAQLRAMHGRLQPLLKKVIAGDDLTHHLSTAAMTKGLVMPGSNPADRGRDIDQVLIRHGLHHFHVGLISPSNPKGRSGHLIFAHVTNDEFRIVAIADHGVFERGSAEQIKFHQLSTAYVTRDLTPGQGYMLNPVMSSGHSMQTVGFSDFCSMRMDAIDPQLDEPAYIDALYTNQPILRDGQPIARPAKPLLTWHFDDLKFGILDRRTHVFFCVSPFFER